MIMPLIVGAAVAKGVFSYLLVVEIPVYHRISRYLRGSGQELSMGGLMKLSESEEGIWLPDSFTISNSLNGCFDGLVRSGQSLIEVAVRSSSACHWIGNSQPCFFSFIRLCLSRCRGSQDNSSVNPIVHKRQLRLQQYCPRTVACKQGDSSPSLPRHSETEAKRCH